MAFENLKEFCKYLKQASYDYEECFLVIKLIGNKSSQINQTRYSNSLGRIQSMLINYCILLLARFFDMPSKYYPTVSIQSILELLEKNRTSLESRLVTGSEKKIQSNGIAVVKKDNNDRTDVIKSIISYFQSEIERNKDVIEKIKQRRDKLIAHNEVIELDRISEINWGEIQPLVDMQRKFIDIMNISFFDIPSIVTDLPDARESINAMLESLVSKS